MKQKILDQYHDITQGMLVLEFLNGHNLEFDDLI